MNEGDVIEILRSGFVAVLMVAGPALLAALATGLAVSIIQALTQIQEVTLAYVPKIVATLVAAMIGLPLSYGALKSFMDEIIQLIVGI